MIEEVVSLIKEWALEFGANNENEFSKSYVYRNNTGSEALKDNGAFFGFLHPDEEERGVFHDFSFTLFPTDQEKPWLLCLGIGSNGFKKDLELANKPGMRRLFSQLIDNEGYYKNDFSDIESGLPKSITSNPNLQHLKKTIKTYTKVLPVCQVIHNPLSESGKSRIKAFLAAYAKVRDWPSNQNHRNAISKALKPFQNEKLEDDRELIFELLKERRFVILQGPPGTGKTTLAKEIATKSSAKSFFTQFHAETTYSDFIYGIRPSLNSDDLTYEGRMGNLAEAVLYSRENPSEKVVLIIDEINRANLSNVLGPVFYLFEHKMKNADVSIQITPELEIKELPSNFYVIATMNTADRSLAVVDFALRRRFAWYTVKPKPISASNFYKDDFNIIAEIFDWHATSNELNLQPGQGYFLADSDEEMEKRIRYEIFPLIREYLQEGLLTSAVEEFNSYFIKRIDQPLFE
jgi:5-methylcytosine-specific restriction protein B